MISAPSTLLSDVALYCSQELGIDFKNVEIHIIECCLKHDGAFGWCYDIIENEVDIEVDINLSDHNKILTLCHEMVHARQAIRGDATFDEDEANGLEQELCDGYIHAAGW
jgi:hypothetical protein